MVLKMTKERKKELETMLYDYKNIDFKIRTLDIHIDAFLNDVRIFVEALTIEDLRQSKDKIIYFKELINNALRKLSEEEYKLIELRYFQRNKKKWVEIGLILAMDKDYCCKKNKKILEKIGQFLDN
jgi:RinA family phage transcriptional activator